jgi:hypothetical protein
MWYCYSQSALNFHTSLNVDSNDFNIVMNRRPFLSLEKYRVFFSLVAEKTSVSVHVQYLAQGGREHKPKHYGIVAVTK